MACPKCECKVTYAYGNSDYMERCAACGEIFDIEMSEDEDEWSVMEQRMREGLCH